MRPLAVHNVIAEFQGRFATPRTATRLIVVHHAADHYKQATGIEDVRAIRDWHVKGRGWGGIGYHEVCAEAVNDGPVACYLVSDPNTQRAHIAKRNHEAFGICCATDFGTGLPAEKWVDALAQRVAAALDRWPNAKVLGHREAALPGHGTACPGGAWAAWKPRLMERVAELRRRPVLAYSPDTSILAGPQVSQDALRATLRGHGDAETLAGAYTYLGRLTGAGNVLPWAQAWHETAGFTSPRWREARNPAGLGATDDGAWGSVFRTIEAGVFAHYAHLLCYAAPEHPQPLQGISLLSPRREALARTHGLGSAPLWWMLTGKWSTDPDYIAKIIRVANDLFGEGR